MKTDRATNLAGRQRVRRRLAMLGVAGLASGVLSGCDWGQIAANGTISILASTSVPTDSASPIVSKTATPVPTATATPIPTRTLAALAKADPTIVAEGDGLSVFWSGNYTGVFAAAHPTFHFTDAAVNGSGISDISARLAADLALKPDIITVMTGSGQLAAVWMYPTTQDWLNALFAYTDKARAAGVKVLVATILPYHASAEANAAEFNKTMAARRAEANAAIIAAAKAGRIDGVIDFAGDPVMGVESAADDHTLYKDGLVPTDGCGMGCGGQGKLASIYDAAVQKALAK